MNDKEYGNGAAALNQSDRPLLGRASFLHAALTGLSIDNRCILDNGVVVESLSEGVLQFTPAQSSKSKTSASAVMISAGVHGNETAPIEVLDLLVDDILAGVQQLECDLLLVLANIPAIRAQKRFTSENMNRLFGAKDQGRENSSERVENSEVVRADELMGLSRQFFAQAQAGEPKKQKIHYDLHTAIRASKHELFAISPNLFDESGDTKSRDYHFDILASMGIEAVLTGTKSHTTFSAFTAQHCGATSFTLELGQVRPFGENDVAKLSTFKQTLRQLIANKLDEETRPSSKPAVYTIVEEVLKKSNAFELCFDDDAANFTAFKQGDMIAKDAQQSVMAAQTGDCIVFPNANVNIGARAVVIARPKATDTHMESDNGKN